jgi:hypothetical protein
MTNLTNLTTTQLRQIIALKEQIEALQTQLDSIAGGEVPTPFIEEVAASNPTEAPVPAKRKYHMSAAHKRKLIKALARARKIRWAKMVGNGGADSEPSKPAEKGKKKDRRSSPAVKAKLRAAAKARWAKARLEGKTTL